MINRAYIFWGSPKEFEKRLPQNLKNKKSLSQLVKESTRIDKDINITVEGKEQERKIPFTENLVAESNEFTSVTEHVLMNFNGFISNMNVQNVYLNNPPKKVMRYLENYFDEITEEYQEYRKIERADIIKLNSNYQENIIGQDVAIKSLLISLFQKVRVNASLKPLVIMFYGPSGVGKTETAKFLAKILEQDLMRKQFSMAQTNYFGDYLYGDGNNKGSFAKDLLDRDSNVILLDEFDKANCGMYSAFYQLFDEGIYEDENYCVALNNAIIICTSNYENPEQMRQELGTPIFSRFEKVIGFSCLTNESKTKIAEREFDLLFNELSTDEQQVIKSFPQDIKNLVCGVVQKLSNVREIRNLIEDCFNTVFLENMLNSKTELDDEIL